MKIFDKKILGLAAIAVALPMSVMAATTTIEATATFREAITLGNEVDMQFGQVDFSGTPGSGDTVTMDVTGAMTSAGNFSAGTTGTAGSVEIVTGTDGLTVDVRCDATATLTDGSTGSIQVTGITVAAENNLAAPATCNGTANTVLSFVLSNSDNANDEVKLGGVLDGATAASFVGGSYSTANTGGDNIQVDIVYQ